MVYKRFSNPTGPYVDKDNNRFDVMETNYAYTPSGINVGWTEFDSMDEALKEWGLTYNPLPEVDPVPEGDESGVESGTN